MFCQPPEKGPSNSAKSSQRTIRRKRKKKIQKNKKKALKKLSHFEISMSSWAEHFTMASTWQLKHQVAHWKSKVRALEYENKILRDMCRQYYVNGGIGDVVETQSNTESVDAEEMCISANLDQEEDTIMPSEEFIEYLRQNREFREARAERIRKANEASQQLEKEREMGPSETSENKFDSLKQLYGSDWERIAALEVALQSDFISICDNDKPSYWPNIPLRM